MIKRVLYFSGEDLTLFEWKHNTLLGSLAFEKSEAGINLFKHTMQKLPNAPLQLLVNILEEDFQRENIPHVNSKERQALTDRLLKRHYRDEKFTHVSLQERSKEGRKDDTVLLSSIGVPDTLQRWLDVIYEMKLPLSGIWSSALLTTDLLKRIFKEEKNRLLVSLEEKNTYRQSLLLRNQLIISRKTKSFSLPTIKDRAEFLLESIDQLHKFANNKRIIDFQEKLKVTCIIRNITYQKLDKSHDDESLEYELITLKDIGEKLSIKTDEKVNMPIIYSFACAKANSYRPHYDIKKEKLPYLQYKMSRLAFYTISLSIIAVLSISGIIAINNINMLNKIDRVERQSQQLTEHYQKIFSPIQNQLNGAVDVQALVEEAEAYKHEATPLPTDLFRQLSNIFSEPEFAQLKPTQLHWQRYTGTELESLQQFFPNSNADEEEIDDTALDYNASYAETREEYEIFAHLSGEFLFDDLSYSETVRVIRLFNDSLQGIDNVNQVYMLTAPVDIRPQSRFTDLSGQQLSIDFSRKENRKFEFIISLDKQYDH